MIYTASRDYGVKRKIITLSHHNKIRISGFYFIFGRKISSTQWISPVEDGFHCVALLRLRGFLHALRLVEMTVLFSHRNFTFGETSLVIDKLHFP